MEEEGSKEKDEVGFKDEELGLKHKGDKVTSLLDDGLLVNFGKRLRYGNLD